VHQAGDLAVALHDRGAVDDVDLVVRRSRWRRLLIIPSFWAGATICLAFLFIAAFGPWLQPHDPILQDRSAAFAGPPTADHPLGTDALGRDYLSRLIAGARVALIVGVGAGITASAIGAVVGALAAYSGTLHLGRRFAGRRVGVQVPVESILMRTTDVVLSLPALLLAIALAAVVGPSVALAATLIAALSWPPTARVVYAHLRVVRESEFVEAARALGAPGRRILTRHVAPQATGVLLAYTAITIAGAILFEAALSYLGTGVPAPQPSWGVMASEHISYYVAKPWLVLVPGLAILVVVIGFTLLSDALRDAFDPRLR